MREWEMGDTEEKEEEEQEETSPYRGINDDKLNSVSVVRMSSDRPNNTSIESCTVI